MYERSRLVGIGKAGILEVDVREGRQARQQSGKGGT